MCECGGGVVLRRRLEENKGRKYTPSSLGPAEPFGLDKLMVREEITTEVTNYDKLEGSKKANSHGSEMGGSWQDVQLIEM